jgi:hypothetical protein
MSELLGGAMLKDLSGGCGARDGKVCDRHTLAEDETMVVGGLDVNGVLHQHLPLQAQSQAKLDIVPEYAWYALKNGALTFVNHLRHGFSGERIQIETPPIIIDSIPTLISNVKTEVIYGNE